MRADVVGLDQHPGWITAITETVQLPNARMAFGSTCRSEAPA